MELKDFDRKQQHQLRNRCMESTLMALDEVVGCWSGTVDCQHALLLHLLLLSPTYDSGTKGVPACGTASFKAEAHEDKIDKILVKLTLKITSARKPALYSRLSLMEKAT